MGCHRGDRSTGRLGGDSENIDGVTILCNICQGERQFNEMYYKKDSRNGVVYRTNNCVLCERQKSRIRQARIIARRKGLSEEATQELITKYN